MSKEALVAGARALAIEASRRRDDAELARKSFRGEEAREYLRESKVLQEHADTLLKMAGE
jgi:hypothetical protein